MVLLSSADFFSKSSFSKTTVSGTLSVIYGFDPGQNDSPDLGSNSLQRLSADDKSRR